MPQNRKVQAPVRLAALSRYKDTYFLVTGGCICIILAHYQPKRIIVGGLQHVHPSSQVGAGEGGAGVAKVVLEAVLKGKRSGCAFAYRYQAK